MEEIREEVIRSVHLSVMTVGSMTGASSREILQALGTVLSDVMTTEGVNSLTIKIDGQELSVSLTGCSAERSLN
ncbi:hypothetical protein [Duffyella gerundensis]|uniref:hypothetical protein n=1 Tax=Duffyella gerundensis TaxID=1619313 RepID=UPI003FD07FB6